MKIMSYVISIVAVLIGCALIVLVGNPWLVG